MANRTHTDSIRDLEHAVVRMAERSDNDRRDIARIEAFLEKLHGALEDTRTRLAVVESKLTESKVQGEETGRRRWTLWMAVLGSILTLVVNIILTAMRR